jgi:hypothetical protein
MGKVISVEIDLDNVFCNENGFPEESVEESIRRQVIEEVSSFAKKNVGTEISNAVHEAVSKLINEAIEEKVPSMIEMLLSEEFTPVTAWGEKSEPTSVRKELLKRFREEFQYIKVDRYGNRQKNKFTEAVDTFVTDSLKDFRKDFDDKVKAEFNKEAMKYVAEVVAKKFCT